MARTAAFELDERSYLREKVIATYERLWRERQLDDGAWTELFFLKVNAAWLQERIAALPAASFAGPQPVVRQLFSQACARLGDGHDASTRSHALETLSGVFLGLGGRSFYNFPADVLDALCGIEAADEAIGSLLRHVVSLLSLPATPDGRALQHAAVRLLLAMAATAENLSSNILLEFVLLRPQGTSTPKQNGAATPSRARANSRAEESADVSLALKGVLLREPPAELGEDVARLLSLLSFYQWHERPNPCLELIGSAQLGEPLGRLLSRVMQRCMYPAESASGADGSSSWGLSMARTLDWTARLLTLEEYLPTSLTSQLPGPHSLRANATQLGAVLLICWEWMSASGGELFAARCAQYPPPAPPRATLLRQYLSTLSLLACDARDGLPCAQLRLGLLSLEALLEGSETRELLLTVDVASSVSATMPMWRLAAGRAEEFALTGGRPILAALLTLLPDLFTQNLRPSRFPAALYVNAIELQHRLLLLLSAAGVRLTLDWSRLWSSVFAVCGFVADDERFCEPMVPQLAGRLLQHINMLLALGDRVFPSGAVFEEFAYELVRLHQSFDRLFKVCKRASPQLLSSMSLARSVISQALDHINALPEGAAASLTAAQAMEIVRKLQLNVPAETKSALIRPPPLPSARDRTSFLQQLLRMLLAQARADGSIAPLHFEELVVSTLD